MGKDPRTYVLGKSVRALYPLTPWDWKACEQKGGQNEGKSRSYGPAWSRTRDLTLIRRAL